MMNATSQGLKQESDYYWEKERVMEGTTRTTKTTKTTREEASFATSRDPFNGGGGGGGGVEDWARLSNEEKIKLWTQDEEDMYRSHLKHTHQQNHPLPPSTSHVTSTCTICKYKPCHHSTPIGLGIFKSLLSATTATDWKNTFVSSTNPGRTKKPMR
jgi:hypothetical protein